jgi:hypothetical protein
VLYQLSYASDAVSVLHPDLIARAVLQLGLPSGKRETGLEPATSSLEGLRSTN